MASLLTLVMGLTLASGLEMPGKMTCTAAQTAGFHDYPHNEESYEAVVFYESSFEVEVNRALTRNLAAASGVDVYVMLSNDDKLRELSCIQVRGVGDTRGLSCRDEPPAEMFLLNLDNLRFTRTAIGGWTFAGAQESTAGDSIYVEYGQCAVD